ncbi:MAG TPA: phosphoenolpyruvate carboxykinase, partial [Acholeplasma sp.]|nr:phosphoenolpyruvate carboxykinase [Acholeplasma sp.]
PPFIINSKSNTRSGLFTKIDNNPLKDLSINPNHFLTFPIKVGPLLAFVYIHRDFIHQGIALSNLFQFANYENFKDKSPDLVYVYGIKESEYDCKYFYDDKEDILIGFVSRDDKNDYFGYLKKMLLTLHNVKMINSGHLPIHGAMVKIKLNDNSIKNVVIVGDSGAGKSETLEAMRLIGNKQIKRMEVVFDDMGTFKINDNNKVVANGTETGAFVRLDDLDTGYAYQIMDRAMFLNPNKVNARVVVPISSYDFIMQNHKVDLFLYANNYDEENSDIKVFENINEALEVFKRGRRKAKGTTSEVGLVESYFANPFGPVQMQQETNILLDKFFNNLKDNKVIIGEIYTKLAVSGHESSGPIEAAKLLLNYLTGKE